MRAPVPQAGDFTHWSREKLRNADTDQFHHVNNAVMASFFEAGRMELFAQDAVHPLMEGANLAVVRLLMNFHREIFYPGEVSIGTRVVRVGNRSVELAQGLFDAAGCAASAEAVCVLLDPHGGGATTVSDALRARLLEGAPA